MLYVVYLQGEPTLRRRKLILIVANFSNIKISILSVSLKVVMKLKSRYICSYFLNWNVTQFYSNNSYFTSSFKLNYICNSIQFQTIWRRWVCISYWSSKSHLVVILNGEMMKGDTVTISKAPTLPIWWMTWQKHVYLLRQSDKPPS